MAAATVNEILRLLQARGAVSLRTGPNGGVFVAEPSPLVRVGQALIAANGNPTAVADAVALRDVIEPLTVLEASRHRTMDDVSSLRDQVERIRDAVDDDTTFAREIWRLHRIIAGIGRNEMLQAISIGLLEIVVNNTRFVVQGSKSSGDREHRIHVHERLVDAIESGDPRLCEQASREHSLGAAPAQFDVTVGTGADTGHNVAKHASIPRPDLLASID